MSARAEPDGPGPSHDPRPLRADAQRNRSLILEAAEEVFATQGVAAPVDLVAERAGVGVGTLYRHFPTKEALFEAIVTSRLTELAASATGCAAEDDAGAAFFSFLRDFARQATRKHDIFDALVAAGIDVKTNCAETVEVLEGAIECLRRRAAAAGAVRGDTTTREIVSLVVGITMASARSGLPTASCEQMLSVLFDGLRAPGAAPVPGVGGTTGSAAP